MKNKSRISKSIFEELKKGNIESAISSISKELKEEKTDKLQLTKTPLLNLIGQKLGKMLAKEKWKFERLHQLWKVGKRDERLIILSALSEISKKDYENSKKFVLEVSRDISDWEICDQLALRTMANFSNSKSERDF